MNEENVEVVGDSPVLNETVHNVVEMFKSQEEEAQKLVQRKWSLEADIEHLKKVGQCLEVEKNELDDEIARLKLRNIAYQREHMNLRNSITVVKFQIQKIKESIAIAKANDLKALENFENAVDEITQKFRSGPVVYDRKILLQKIAEEKEKREVLIKKLAEVEELYENFCKTNGLKLRKNKTEELLNCVLPDSALSCFIEMTKTLDEVISGVKNLPENSTENEKNCKDLDSVRISK